MQSIAPTTSQRPKQEQLVTQTYQRSTTPSSQLERLSNFGDDIPGIETSEANDVHDQLRLRLSARHKQAINFFRGGRIISAAVAATGISGLVCSEMMGEKNDKAVTHGLLTGVGTFFYFLSSCSGLDGAGEDVWKRWRSNLADGIVPAVMVATVYFGRAHGVI